MEKKYIALTFDDGPNTTTTSEVLDILEKYHVKGSFFLVGDEINEESIKQAKRAFDMGCEINNHSKTHPAMPEMSKDEILAEVEFTNQKIIGITGKAPLFFRPPYIAVNDLMLDIIPLTFIAGYGCSDWLPEVSAEERYKKVMEQADNGAIILLHDAKGNDNTVAALEMIIPDLISQGYDLVTVSDLFRLCGCEPKKGVVYSSVFDR